MKRKHSDETRRLMAAKRKEWWAHKKASEQESFNPWKLAGKLIALPLIAANYIAENIRK